MRAAMESSEQELQGGGIGQTSLFQTADVGIGKGPPGIPPKRDPDLGIHQTRLLSRPIEEYAVRPARS